ncbi:Plastidal glycolate/glycerate translocator 1, chloroplastic [Phlyctema vagabunda]|uniref:Plastidal glycolate/glycerate translocator 1, chloroplastic n=1 Tax=Phlyctema vagabunda TaxID=108571 RepID=A0ABR4PP84_9HELO
MATNQGLGAVLLADAIEALKLVFRLSWRRNITAWLSVPCGIVMILLACFGVDSLIGLSSVSFPASVACMILLFFALIISDVVVGARRTNALVKIIDIPAGFALRYINIFFTPSFVLLPLSPSISGVEVAKMIAVFLIGFVVVFAATAWTVRGLQLIMGSSKRTMTERAEELGHEDDAIPLADLSRSRLEPQSADSGTSTPREDLRAELANDLAAPPRAQDPSLIRGTGGPPESNTISEALRTIVAPQASLPLTRPQRWAALINMHFDRITYFVIFIFIGLPVYYATGYAMPVQLTFNVLAYFAAVALPAKWRQFLHPVLVSSLITCLGIWVLGLIKGDSLHDVLGDYKTGTKYTQLWHGKTNLRAPGAGDIFSSVLDASIVALSLPMFQYRKELQRHFFAIVIPNVAVSIASLFGYPAVCYAIGISSTRSLSFAARSLTLALATPAVSNLGGDLNTIAALTIMSGILGVLVGSKLLELLRIPEDDYVTRGVTLGGSSSAIATALLLVTDPRAAALSSLSMSLFGTITIILTSVPPIVSAITSMVGL